MSTGEVIGKPLEPIISQGIFYRKLHCTFEESMPEDEKEDQSFFNFLEIRKKIIIRYCFTPCHE